MERRKAIICTVFIWGFFSLFIETLTAQEMEFDSEYENYSYSFKSLEGEEILTYTYAKNTLEVFKINKSLNKELVNSWSNIRYGNYQISENRKKIVFTIYKSGYYRPTFLVDGVKGTVTYLFNAPNGYRTDKEMKYMVGTDWNTEVKTKSDYNEIMK